MPTKRYHKTNVINLQESERMIFWILLSLIVAVCILSSGSYLVRTARQQNTQNDYKH